MPARRTIADPTVAAPPVGASAEQLPPPVVDDRVPPPVYRDLPYEDREREQGYTVTQTRSTFSFSQFVHALCGVALAAGGAVTMARAGFDTPLAEQTTEILGITQSTALGIAELAAGLLLIAAALTPHGRRFGGFIGALVAIGGLVVVAASDELLADLRTEQALGWVLMGIGGAALVAAFFPTRSVRRSEVHERAEVRV
jgi:hypothetical protein